MKYNTEDIDANLKTQNVQYRYCILKKSHFEVSHTAIETWRVRIWHMVGYFMGCIGIRSTHTGIFQKWASVAESWMEWRSDFWIVRKSNNNVYFEIKREKITVKAWKSIFWKIWRKYVYECMKMFSLIIWELKINNIWIILITVTNFCGRIW